MRQKLLFLFTFFLAAIGAQAKEVYIIYTTGTNKLYFEGDDVTRKCSLYNPANGNDAAPSGFVEYHGDIVVPSTVTDGGKTYTVVQITQGAFSCCPDLNSVVVPDGVALDSWGPVFNGSSKLTSVTLPADITNIPSGTFRGCTSLTKVTYNGCTNTQSDVVLPEGVTAIYGEAFKDCKKITSITLPNSLLWVTDDAFKNCNLKHFYGKFASSDNRCFVVNGELQMFGYDASFTNTTYSIPAGVTKICDRVFSGCSLLTSIYIPNTVASIGQYAFNECTNLVDVSIPTSVTSIGSGAFNNTGLYNDESKWNNGFLCVDHCILAVKPTANNGNFLINNSVRLIAEKAFENNTHLASVSIPSTMTTVGNYAFYGCTNLATVNFNSSITAIGDYSFEDCTSLTNVTLPTSLNTIGKYAFHNCNGLVNITIPNNVQKIDDKAFYNCRNLTKVNMHASNCTEIGSNNSLYAAFDRYVQELNISESVRTIPAYAFSMCSGLTKITIKTANPSTITVGTGIFTSSIESTCELYVPSAGISLYRSTAPWKRFSNIKAIVIPAESIRLDKTTLTLAQGSSQGLSASVLPTNTSDQTVTWTSSNTDVATVNANGYVTAVAVGTATITATCGSVSATCAVTVTPVYATSVTLNQSTMTLLVGATGNLNATVKPDNAINKTVTWSSSNTAVATVDQNGKVTAVSVGEATIWAIVSGNGGNVSQTCQVTVNPVLPTSVTLNKTSLSLKIGEEETLTATILPANVTNKSVNWITSNSTVATVVNGKITAKKEGTATITARCSSMTATCTVTVTPVYATSVTLDKSSAEITMAETVTLTATVKPDNTSYPTVSWYSGNTAVATVNNGVVTPVSVGEARIEATCDSKTAYCYVTVKPVLATSVTLDATTIEILQGTTHTLAASILPENTTFPTATWTSSDESVATVDNGVVTAVSVGVAMITAACDGKSATCKVLVYPEGTELSYYRLNDNKSVMVIQAEYYSRYETIDIPEAVLIDDVTYNVAAIDTKAFENCTNLTSISLPRSIVYIAEDAFSGCTSLAQINASGTMVEEIEIPDEVPCKILADNCLNLKTLTTGRATTDFSVANCPSLETLVIGQSIPKVSGKQFGASYHEIWSTPSLKNLTIADATTTLSIESVEVEEGYLPAIPGSIKNLYIGRNLRATGSTILRHFNNAVSTVEFGSNVTAIDRELKESFASVVSITAPSLSRWLSISKAYPTLSYYLYEKGGDEIKEVDFEGYTSIPGNALLGCKSIENVVIPASVETVGASAFQNCTSLTSVYCHPRRQSTYNSSVFSNVNSDCKIYVPVESVDEYKAGWSSFEHMICPVYMVDSEIENLAINDGDALYICEEECSGVDVSYIRAFTSSANWQPLFLPFSMDYADWKEIGQLAELAEMRLEGETIVLRWTTVRDEGLTAGKPYIFKPKTAGDATFDVENTTLIKSSDVKLVHCENAQHSVDLYGTFTGFDDFGATGFYAMSGGNFKRANPGVKLKPFRIYLDVHAPAGANRAPMMRTVVDDTETGVEGIEIANRNGDGAYYDMQGRSVTRPMHGVYIKDGKKIIVK